MAQNPQRLPIDTSNPLVKDYLTLVRHEPTPSHHFHYR